MAEESTSPMAPLHFRYYGGLWITKDVEQTCTC